MSRVCDWRFIPNKCSVRPARCSDSNWQLNNGGGLSCLLPYKPHHNSGVNTPNVSQNIHSLQKAASSFVAWKLWQYTDGTTLGGVGGATSLVKFSSLGVLLRTFWFCPKKLMRGRRRDSRLPARVESPSPSGECLRRVIIESSCSSCVWHDRCALLPRSTTPDMCLTLKVPQTCSGWPNHEGLCCPAPLVSGASIWRWSSGWMRHACDADCGWRVCVNASCHAWPVGDQSLCSSHEEREPDHCAPIRTSQDALTSAEHKLR